MGNVVTFPHPRRAWDAGKVDHMRGNWPIYSAPIVNDIRRGLRAIRTRSRHEAQNNDHMMGFLRDVRSNVLGAEGIRYQSRARMQNGKPDKRAQGVLEENWQEWGAFGVCEVTGTRSWKAEQKLAVTSLARDGEIVIRLISGWEENRWGFAIQQLDPELLDVDYSEELPGGNAVIMGVEVNQWGRPVAFHFSQPDPLGRTYKTGRRGRNNNRDRVPADEIVHWFLPEWHAATRGVPWAATALRRMTDINGYDEAAVLNARAGASKMGWIQASPEAPPLNDETGKAQSELVSATGSDGHLYTEFDPGSIGLLPPGYEFVGWNPNFPSGDHGQFIKPALRGVATGLGMDYNTLGNDAEGVNYNSLRHFALVKRDIYAELQSAIAEAIHQRIFNGWLKSALQFDALKDSRGNRLRLDREAEFRRSTWLGRRWQWVDPMKDAAAAEKEIDMRARSISSVIRDRGEDPETVWDEIERENDELERRGISREQAAAAATAPAAPTTEGEDD